MKKSSFVKWAMALSCASLVACGGSGESQVQPILMTDFTWNFDAGDASGLTIDGLWHISAVQAASAPNSLRYADPDTGTYDTGDTNSGSIVLPEMALGDAPLLNLYHLLINECEEGICGWDRLTINVSTDEGATYTEIEELVPSPIFEANAIDLSAYAGQTVTIAINFDTVDDAWNAYEGAYVDDINVSDSVWTHTVRVLGDELVTDENGAEQTFQVVLNTPPAANVSIPVHSDNTAEGLIKGGNYPANYVPSLTLTFTPTNWNVPQTVTVKGQSDGVVDDDQLYNIVLGPAVSNDLGYSGVDARDVTVVNVNTNDVACDGTNLSLSDDDYRLVNLGFTFSFQGSDWTDAYIGSNGYLTFGFGDSDLSESISEFLNEAPRIAALWDDLYPPSGGTVSCTNTATSMTVSFDGVPEINTNNSNTFSITLNSNGSIVINYGSVDVQDALVGITQGSGAADPGETDLSAAPVQSKTGTVYELFTGSTDPFDLSGQTLTFQ